MNLREYYGKKTSEKITHEEPATYTTAQIAEKLQITEQSVRNLIKKNNLPTIPGIKKVLISRTVFDEFLNSKNGG